MYQTVLHFQSHTSISSHLLLFIMDTMKQITSKLTTDGSFFLVSRTTETLELKYKRLSWVTFLSVASV